MRTSASTQGIEVGLAALTDDELLQAIEATRRLVAAQDAGAEPDPADVALAERVAALSKGPTAR